MESKYLTPKQIERCEQMIENISYGTDNPHDGSDVILAKYFQEQKCTYDEGFEKWLPIYESRYGDFNDDHRFFADSLYKAAWTRASSMKPLNKEMVKIYKGELDYINSVVCDRWVKELALLILVDCKIAKKYKFSTEFFNPLVNYTSVPRKCSANREKAMRELRDTGILTIEKKERFDWINGETDVFTNYIFNFPKASGEIVFEANRCVDAVEYFGLITMLKPCIQCGALFEYNSKTKRNICDKCWHEERKDVSRLCMKALRAPKN